eukprot:TRINITY_DN2023_c0_g3_i1.p1 TRINITY_DN2023_c0_g3~~TRINITY_DN2023_c0_g3_i1.p1  ORF type:complete len:243 (-),score=57.35 TRINITY_DN2023_c0_g3_i1:143-781(-)
MGVAEQSAKILFNMFDKDVDGGDDFMGAVEVSLEEVMASKKGIEKWFNLTGDVEGKPAQGAVYLKIVFAEKLPDAKDEKMALTARVAEALKQSQKVHTFYVGHTKEQKEKLDETLAHIDQISDKVLELIGEDYKTFCKGAISPACTKEDDMVYQVLSVRTYYVNKVEQLLKVSRQVDEVVEKLHEQFQDDYYKFCQPDSIGTLEVIVIEAKN